MGISEVVQYLRNPNPIITTRLLRLFGAKVGEKTTVKRSIFLDNVYEDEHSVGDFRFLKVGKNCYIGDNVYFDLANVISIGNDAVMSGQVSVITHADCNRSEYLAEKFPRVCQPVTIGDGAWIGFKTTILTGVTIGDRSVIAANSLVRENVEPYTLYAGVPAKRVYKLE